MLSETSTGIDEASRRLGGIAAALLVGAALLELVRVAAVEFGGTPTFTDDAYYYAIIAKNFAATGRFTFDGIDLTNGFHPLWFGFLTGMFWLLGTDVSANVGHLVHLAVGAAFFLATVLALAWLPRRHLQTEDRHGIYVALILVTSVLVTRDHARIFLNGMESALTFPLLLLTGVLLIRGRWLGAGLAGAALALARLDTFVFILLPLAACSIWPLRSDPRRLVIRGAQIVAPALSVLAIFMLANWIEFGHPMPIHGRLKSSFPIPNLQWHQVIGTIYTPGGFYRYKPSLALLASSFGVIALASSRRRQDLRRIGLVAALLCGAQLASFALFQRWAKPIPPWYWGLPLLTGGLALALGVACRVSPRAFSSFGVAVASVGFLWNVSATGAELSRERGSSTAGGRAGVELLSFLREAPEDSVWAATDCGVTAYWSGQRVVNLDGVANNAAYQERLRDGELEAYLRDHVRYLIVTAWDRRSRARRLEPMYAYSVAPDVFSGDYTFFEYRTYSYLYEKYSETVRLPREAEVFRSAAWNRGPVQMRHLVFDLELIPRRPH